MKKISKAILMAAVCVFSMMSLAACGKSDKEIVLDAFKSFANVKGFDVASEMGIKNVFEKLDGKAYETGLEIVLEDSAMYELSMLKSASVEMKVASDPDAEKAGVELGVGMGGIKLVSAEGYFDDKQIALKVPELIDKVFVLDYSGDVLEKVKNSAFVKAMGMDTTELEELIKVYTDALKNQEGQTEAILEIVKYFEDFDDETKAYSDFKDAIEVVAIDAEEFEINGKDKKCDGYEIVITTESMVDLCKEAIDYFVVSDDAQALWKGYIEDAMSSVEGVEDMSVEDVMAEYYSFVEEYEASQEELWKNVEDTIKDIEMEMFIYEDEIASLEGEIVIAQDNVKAEFPFELVCTGGESSIYENFELELDLTAAEAGKVVITRETESDKEVYESAVNVSYEEYVNFDWELVYYKEDKELEFTMDIEADYESMSFKVEAALDELEKGKAFTLDIDEISLVYDEEELITLSGEFYVSDDVDIEIPSGDKVDVLMTDEEEFMEVMQELMTAVESFSSILGY